MRFLAPARAAVATACFDHAVFAGYRRHRDLLAAAEWPDLAALNRRRAEAGVEGVAFVEQTPALLRDGLHYEQRVAAGVVATRAGNWHDLLNALVWIEHAGLKAALNARQVADIAAVGPRQRTRGQCALTHFDEAGVVVAVDDGGLLAAWDRHDWMTVFKTHAAAWRGVSAPLVFGHALLEHALLERPWLVAKALVIAGPLPAAAQADALAAAIADGRALTDPLQLRPLPLCGVPGWDDRAAEAGFFASAPCFQPIRPDRTYPPPLRVAR